jgi:hypothetical protein
MLPLLQLNPIRQIRPLLLGPERYFGTGAGLAREFGMTTGKVMQRYQRLEAIWREATQLCVVRRAGRTPVAVARGLAGFDVAARFVRRQSLAP